MRALVFTGALPNLTIYLQPENDSGALRAHGGGYSYPSRTALPSSRLPHDQWREVPLVVGPDYLPVPTPNQWMLLLRRPQVQAGTLTDEMRTVAHVHEWASRRGIDLDERFASGNGLRPDEANALYQNLRYERSLGRRVAARRLTNANELVVVAGATQSARVAIARDYLVWGLERTLYRLDVGNPLLQPSAIGATSCAAKRVSFGATCRRRVPMQFLCPSASQHSATFFQGAKGLSRFSSVSEASTMMGDLSASSHTIFGDW